MTLRAALTAPFVIKDLQSASGGGCSLKCPALRDEASDFIFKELLLAHGNLQLVQNSGTTKIKFNRVEPDSCMSRIRNLFSFMI